MGSLLKGGAEGGSVAAKGGSGGSPASVCTEKDGRVKLRRRGGRECGGEGRE